MSLQALEYQLLRAARFAPTSTAGMVADKYLEADNLLEAIQLRLTQQNGYGFWSKAEPRILAQMMANADLGELLPDGYEWVLRDRKADKPEKSPKPRK